MRLILASTSAIRHHLLTSAGVSVVVQPARIDEESIRQSLEAEAAKPRDMADTLAELKARKIAERFPEDLVIGCDQILDLKGKVFSKPSSVAEAGEQLRLLRGKVHSLWSAVVIYEAARPVWRVVAETKLTMRSFSDAYLDAYLARNWPSVRDSVGAYKLEEEGSRLFSAVDGDYFTVLGLPLLPVLGYLGQRGLIQT